jgi:hypothetical protein
MSPDEKGIRDYERTHRDDHIFVDPDAKDIDDPERCQCPDCRGEDD